MELIVHGGSKEADTKTIFQSSGCGQIYINEQTTGRTKGIYLIVFLVNRFALFQFYYINHPQIVIFSSISLV